MRAKEHAVEMRRLDIQGTYNVRDLGGYATQDGHRTRWHTLLRGDKLDKLTPAGQQALVDYGIRTVIDLRYTPEVATEPDVVATSSVIRYIHIPLYELNGDGTLPAVPDDLEQLYRLILDYRQAQIARIIRIFMAPDTLPALFHCTAGKDRTGLIAALVLGAVGVPDDTIVDDYVLSAQYLDSLFEELRVQARLMGYDGDWYDRLLMCQPDIIRHTLAYLRKQYDGIPEYLRRSGLTEDELDRLHTLMVEPNSESSVR